MNATIFQKGAIYCNKKAGAVALLLLFNVLLPLVLLAQTVPQGMHYQAVARNPDGTEIRSQFIDVKISILSEGVNGVSQWTEEHPEVQTNPFGVFNIEIGKGEHLGGLAETFAEIPWGSASHFLKIEIDFGTGYRDMGTTQFLSVPYALYSGYAVNGGSGGTGSVDVKIDGRQLTIGNTEITLPDSTEDDDSDPENEIQNLSLDGHKLSLTKGGNTITLPDSVNDADADPTNELQDLSINGKVLSISDGNSIELNFNDADSDTLNEIQNLSLSESNILTITRNENSRDIDLNPFLDNTDEQELFINLEDKKLGISNGSEVDLTPLIDDADADPENEIQDLSLDENNTLTITGHVNPTEIELDKYIDNTDEQALSLVNDTIRITNSSSRVPLTKYLDNTDEQTLELTSDNVLVISGSNDSVDLKVDLIGFKARKNPVDPPVVITSGNSVELEFAEIQDFGNCYDALNYAFIVPLGQGGLYQFSVSYDFDPDQELVIEKNNTPFEVIGGGDGSNLEGVISNTSMMFLSEGDEIKIIVNAYGLGELGAGSFAGYRIR